MSLLPKDRNQRVLVQLVGVVLVMGALAWAAVPFYNWFCRVTGYGGTTQVSASHDQAADITDQDITIRFDGNTDPNLPWTFRPMQTELTLKIGSETDKAKRDAMIQEAFQIHIDDVGHLPLHQQALAWGVNKLVDLPLRGDNYMPFKWITVKAK